MFQPGHKVQEPWDDMSPQYKKSPSVCGCCPAVGTPAQGEKLPVEMPLETRPGFNDKFQLSGMQEVQQPQSMVLFFLDACNPKAKTQGFFPQL